MASTCKQHDWHWANGTSSTRRDHAPEGSPTVAILDVENRYRRWLAARLRDHGFQVDEFDSPEGLFGHLAFRSDCDLLVLDLAMTESSGAEVLKRLQRLDHDRRPPAVVLAARPTETEEEMAFDCGAVDYIDKSRSASILAKRLRLVANGTKSGLPARRASAQTLRVGPLTINLKTNRAYWRGRRVPLTLTEFKIVHLLASQSGEEVSYRRIYDVVHGRNFVAGDGPDGYRTNVRSLIRRIRRKFRTIDDTYDEIENYPGFGYCWRRPAAHGEVNVALEAHGHAPSRMNGNGAHVASSPADDPNQSGRSIIASLVGAHRYLQRIGD